MGDIASLNIRITTEEVKAGTVELQKLEKQGARTEKSMDALSATARKLAGYFAAWKVGAAIKDAALLAARYETLGVTMRVAGKNAGFSATQMALFEKQLQSQGIAAVESREVLTRMAAAYMDLGEASKLAAAAQNLAVAGGINSSEAFERLVYAIQSGQTEMLRTIGLNVQFDAAYQAMATSLGKNVAALTSQEKMQARVNVVLEGAAGYAGLYEEAMKTAGKQITSFARYWQDLQLEFGKAQLPAVTKMVEKLKDELKKATDYLKQDDVQESLEGIGDTAFETVENLLKVAAAAGSVLKTVLDGWNKLPEIIQQTGLVVALVGGAKGIASVAALGVLVEWVVRLDKTIQNVSDGYTKWQDLVFSGMDGGRAEIARVENLRKALEKLIETREKDAAIMAGGATTGKLVGSGGMVDLAAEWNGAHPVKAVDDTTTTAKVLAAQNALAGLRREIEAIQAKQQGSPTADLLGIDDDYANRVERIRENLADPKLEAGVKTALEEQLALEEQKYAVEREYAEKRIALEQEVTRADLQQQLARLQGVDAYEAQKAAIRAKYAQVKLQPGSTEAQFADAMQAAELAQVDRDRLATMARQDAEYAKLTHNSEAYYQAMLNEIKAGITGNETLRQKLILQEQMADLQARIDGDTWYAVKEGLDEFADSAGFTFDTVKDLAVEAADGMSEVFTDAIFDINGSLDSLEDTASSIMRSIAKMVIESSITAPLANSISSGISNWFGSAKGNVLTGSGISALSGGVYDKPTYFGFDRHLTGFAQGGVLAEGSKPELVAPVTRMANGEIGLNVEGVSDKTEVIQNTAHVSFSVVAMDSSSFRTQLVQNKQALVGIINQAFNDMGKRGPQDRRR